MKIGEDDWIPVVLALIAAIGGEAMSILNGQISDGVLGAEKAPFGEALADKNFIELEGCASIASDGAHFAYCVCGKGMVVYDIRDKASPREIACLGNVFAGREICYMDGFVYIAARANGLYIADVSDPYRPELVCVYDTLELATSVDVAEHLCFVANRHHGVEIVDIRNPRKPVFVSSFLCGEAQAVFTDGGFVYVGDWMNRRVHIVSIEDVERPRTASVINLDGFADGVFVRDGICYAATGHHSAKLKNRTKYNDYPYITAEMLNDGYGAGHGLEIYDVHDPYQPEFISCIKFPPLMAAPDLWKVVVSGECAYVSDSNNGLFVVDVSDVYHPRIRAYFLDELSRKPHHLGCRAVQYRHAPVVGCLPLEGYLYVCASETGLHVMEFPESRSVARGMVGRTAARLNAQRVFRCAGQIHSMIFCAEVLFAAAGNEGLLALDERFEVLHRLAVQTMDVAQCGRWIVTANAGAGIGVHRYDRQRGFALCDTALIEEGRIGAKQIAVLNEGFIAVQAENAIAFFAIDSDGKLKSMQLLETGAMLYYRNLAQGLLNDRYFAYASLNRGVDWIEIGDRTVKTTQFALNIESCPIEDGVAVADEYAVMISRGRYAVIRHAGETENAVFCKLDEIAFKGVPFIFDSCLVLLNRCNDYADLFDIAQPEHPRYIGRAGVPKPSAAMMKDQILYVCCGHDGIYRLDDPLVERELGMSK